MPEFYETGEFIDSLKRHDHASFTRLFNEIGDDIFNLANRMVGNQEDASDITQTTFLQVYQHIDTFREESRLFTWIFSITRHLCLQRINKNKKLSFDDFERLIEFGSGENHPDSEITPQEKQNLINQVKEGCLTGLVRCLSFNQRMAFILQILFHLPVNEVSVILDKSNSATRVLTHRAKKNLKKFLCKNCSLYHPQNPCHCEDLVSFSLKKNWITKGKKIRQGDPDYKVIDDEVQNFKEIIRFYRENFRDGTSPAVQQQIKDLINNTQWEIFSG
jgi:RNA polymerase sigma factor (sigma-70 family)